MVKNALTESDGTPFPWTKEFIAVIMNDKKKMFNVVFRKILYKLETIVCRPNEIKQTFITDDISKTDDVSLDNYDEYNRKTRNTEILCSVDENNKPTGIIFVVFRLELLYPVLSYMHSIGKLI